MVVNINEFHKLCGQILRMRASIEDYLEFFISQYFCHPQSYRTYRFRELVLNHMNFEQKKRVFYGICKREGVDKERLKTALEAISKVQKIGNAVAHHEGVIERSGQENMYLEPKKGSRSERERIVVTVELMQEVNDNRLVAIQNIVDFHKKFNI